MTYGALLARLYRARRFGVKLELERMHRVLERLGAPEQRLGRVIHVAGTNGKGSTVAFCEALLREAGLRVAAFTSPHLVQFRERFQIDGAPVSEAALVDAGARVDRAAVDGLTFFEQVTAMAAVAFGEARVDATVLEVGLGGRFDATNAIGGDVAVVTGVALDHQAQLGDTLDRIAAEKAGIARAGRPLVIGCAGEPAAIAAVEAAGRARGAAPISIAEPVGDGVGLGLPGAFQRANAGCALAAVRAVVSVAEPAAHRALAVARCPGRFERVAAAPETIVDGAHNPHAARAVADELAGRPGVLACVLGASAGKDVHGIVAPLARLASLVVATRSTSDRAGAPGRIAEAARRANPRAHIAVEPDVARAIEHARGAGCDRVLVAGSLFLVGDARRILLDLERDPVDLADPLR